MTPFLRHLPMSRWCGKEAEPFLAFRREMNRLFDDALRGFGMPSLGGPVFGGLANSLIQTRTEMSCSGF